MIPPSAGQHGGDWVAALDYPYQVRDARDLAGGRLRQAGLEPERFEISGREDIKVFLEAHIEQASVLEQAGKPVGIVSAIAAPSVPCNHQGKERMPSHAHVGWQIHGRCSPSDQVEELALTSSGHQGHGGFPAGFREDTTLFPLSGFHHRPARHIGGRAGCYRSGNADYSTICKERGLTWTAGLRPTALVQISRKCWRFCETTAQRLGLDYHVLPSCC